MTFKRAFSTLLALLCHEKFFTKFIASFACVFLLSGFEIENESASLILLGSGLAKEIVSLGQLYTTNTFFSNFSENILNYFGGVLDFEFILAHRIITRSNFVFLTDGEETSISLNFSNNF